MKMNDAINDIEFIIGYLFADVTFSVIMHLQITYMCKKTCLYFVQWLEILIDHLSIIVTY